jgi:hypothetical protein
MSAPFLCHDFKSPRTDNSRRLPSSMRIVPVLFYVVSLFSVYSMIRDYQTMKSSGERKIAAEANRDSDAAKKTTLSTELTDLKSQKDLGEQVAKWVEGTRPLQPISVSIARSIHLRHAT